jgi:hypothetical protein
VPFSVLWARGVQGEILLGDLTGSEGGPACDAQTLDSIGLTNIVRKENGEGLATTGRRASTLLGLHHQEKGETTS